MNICKKCMATHVSSYWDSWVWTKALDGSKMKETMGRIPGEGGLTVRSHPSSSCLWAAWQKRNQWVKLEMKKYVVLIITMTRCLTSKFNQLICYHIVEHQCTQVHWGPIYVSPQSHMSGSAAAYVSFCCLNALIILFSLMWLLFWKAVYLFK